MNRLRFPFVVLLFALVLAVAPGARAAALFSTNATWKYLKGFGEASSPDPAAWRQTNFNDTAWASGPAPFYYGETLTGTLLSDMRSNYTCVFFRKTFVLSNVSEVGALQLGSYSDDGFIAWINGVEVRRFNMPGVRNDPVLYTGVASSAPAEPVPFNVDTLNDPIPATYLVTGTNVIAVQGFNVSLNDSSDFVLNVSLSSSAPDLTAPTIADIDPDPGPLPSLTQITVTFSEPVAGVDATDLLLNGTSAASVAGGDATYTFTFTPQGLGTVQATWSTNHGITDLANPPNAFDPGLPGHTWEYQIMDNVPPVVTDTVPLPSVTVRALTEIRFTFSEPVTGVEAADLLVNGSPATGIASVNAAQYVISFPPPPTGTVQVAWATNHGITDFAPMPNAFAGGSWSYVLDPNAPAPDLVLNEFLAANVSTNGLLDEDSTPTDPNPEAWIEIHNRGSNTVDLAGWALSDDPDLLSYWAFPSYALAGGQYLVVFASGKDRRYTTPTNRFHTNFRLSRNGEHLGLYSPDSPRALVSGFSPQYPEQRNDISYGYDPAGNLRYFTTPTPGAPNGASLLSGVCEPVHFSVTRGFYSNAFNLHLSTATPGATIRYTTNGSEPTLTSGVPYTNAVRISATRLIRAAAFKTNHLSSRVATHTYFFNLSAAQRSLPVISIVTDGRNLWGPLGIIGISNVAANANGEYVPIDSTGYHNPSRHGLAWERPMSVEYIVPADNSGFQVDCGMRVQGSDYQRPRTTPASKFSFRLYFRSDYGAGRLNYPLFADSPVTSFDQLVLRAGFNDNSNPFIRDEWTRRLWLDQGQVGVHGNFANLFTNGVYAGYYNPCERVHEEMLQSYHGGDEDWDVVSPTFAQSASGPGIVDGDRVSFVSLVSYLNTQNAASPAIYQEIGRRLDLVNYVDYLLVNLYTAMGDWPANNFRAGKDRAGGTTDGIFRFYVWDAEWACNIYGSRPPTTNVFIASLGDPHGSGLAYTGSEIAQMYQRLRVSPEFRLLFADRIRQHFFNDGALTDRHMTNRFYELRAQMLGVLPGMNLDIVSTWVPQRRSNLFSQFALYGYDAYTNAPGFNQHGGRVPRGFTLTITNTAGTIYYTTNGDDPRVAFTGALAASAQAYTNNPPLRLFDTVTVKARSLVGTNWSALTEATFLAGALGVPLRVTEIMYNPPAGPAAANAYEFLELQNVSGAALDLSGMSFTEGISLVFTQGTTLAGGATMVIASDDDPAAFAQRYGVTPGALFGGSLANGGERLTLVDRFGQVVFTVDYDDERGWATAADGAGYSLEVNDPFGSPDDPANWRASAAAGGSAGAQSSPPPLGDVRLNELMAENGGVVSNDNTFPDWVELHNAGGVPVDLTGWSLTDDGNARKFVFPATNLPPGGFLVVWCDATTNTTPGLHTGFQLDRDGESLFLFNAATTRVDAVTFGLQLTNHSLGRVDGEWTLNVPTPDAPNVAAALASQTNLALNEWMANPVPGEDDWVELFNRDATLPVSLQGIYLGTSNALQQLTALSFVGPGGFAQIFAHDANDVTVGPDHVDFPLPASGTAIILSDATGAELQRVTYTNALEGVSRGRLPDGSATIVNFPGSASPEAPNYTINYTGPYLNEVLARNRGAVTNGVGQVADFLEIFNPTTNAVDLAGMSLSVDEVEPGQWVFPAGSLVPAGGYLVVWCDGGRAASTNAEAYLQTGRALDGSGGGAYLFNAAGQLVNFIEYGVQLDNASIGRIGTTWRLLTAPTPGATNAAAVTLGAVTALRLNEWLANPLPGEDDWFEVYNTTNRPVDLGGLLLTDDPSLAGVTNTRLAALSFIGANGWVKFTADGNEDAGRDHVGFVLDAEGESLVLYATNLALIDAVYFGPQLPGVSEGRLLDGSSNLVSFAGSPSPGYANYLPLGNVVVNEVLTHTDPPLEDAVEFFNAGAAAVNLGGWFLSNSRDSLKKFRLAAGTMIPAGGFLVLYEGQFNDGSSNAFTFNAARGDEVWLSEADGAGNLTGYRATASFGAQVNGVSFGRHATSVGVDFVALTARSFGVDNPASVAQFRTGTGAANAAVRVGPVVLSELMYHPPDVTNGQDVVDNTADEFIELRNITAGAVALFDTNHPTNTWRLGGGVEFAFPTGVTLAADEAVMVVNFDPVADPAAEAAFRAKYGVPMGVRLFGPYDGRLANDGESIELYLPDTPQPPGGPDAGYVPQVLVDRVDYRDAPPWPAGAVDGGGLSLQRRQLAQYGNEPLNWVADAPTAGAANGSGIVTPPAITAQPSNVTAVVGTTALFTVGATGGAPLTYQWRFNGFDILGATNGTLALEDVQLPATGTYDVIVSNPGGSAISATAQLVVNAPPVILVGPVSQSVSNGLNVTFSVQASGTAPLSYQWLFNGEPITGATNTSLLLTNVQVGTNGTYTVVVSNFIATASASATLLVLTRPVITQQPTPATQTIAEGGTLVLTVSVSNNATLPMVYRWRRQTSPQTNYLFTNFSYTHTLVIPNVVSNLHSGTWNAVITNIAGPTTPALSANAVVTILRPPVITLHPTNQVVDPGSNVTFVAAATGQAPLGYQWYFNGTNVLADATNTSLSLSNVNLSHDGGYTFVASNQVGLATSQVGYLSVRVPLTLTLQPSNQTATVCSSNVSFTVGVSGGGPPRYQWYFNGTNVLAGASNATLVIANPLPANAGAYHAVVSNVVNAVTSAPATLTITLGDCDGDGLPDDWELANGLNPNGPGDRNQDADGDTMKNWEEYLAGTNPRDNTSYLKVDRITAGGSAVIYFTAVSNRTYTVEHSTDLPGLSPWTKLRDVEAQPVTRTESVTDTNAAGARLYRLVTPKKN